MNTSAELLHMLREVREHQQSIDDRLTLILEAIPGQITAGKIIQEASIIWGCEKREITAPRGKRSTAIVTDCRRAISKIMRDEFPEMNLASIARRLGRSDHATIYHHIQRANELLGHNDPDFTQKFNLLKERLGI